jgi:hypothetical protein
MTWKIRANMRVLLRIILEKYGLKMWAGYMGFYEYFNEIVVSIKG